MTAMTALSTCHDRYDREHDPGVGEGLPRDGGRVVALLMERGIHQVGSLKIKIKQGDQSYMASCFWYLVKWLVQCTLIQIALTGHFYKVSKQHSYVYPVVLLKKY